MEVGGAFTNTVIGCSVASACEHAVVVERGACERGDSGMYMLARLEDEYRMWDLACSVCGGLR